jgi:hypothetical protein
MSKSSFYSGSGLTTTEQSTLEGIQGASEAARDAAQVSATSAATSDTSAATSATSAATSATSAATSLAALSTDLATTAANGLMSSADKTKINGVETGATTDQTAAEIKTSYETNSDTNAFTDADHTKLNAIEASATADQTAGEIEAIVSHDNLVGFVTNEHIDWSTTQVSNIHASNYTDTNTTYSIQDGELTQNNFTNTLKSKLDGVEASSTTDQTASEIKTAYESNADTNAFTDADHTKLNAIEASADVTDATNVTAAGALMDSEVTNLAQVKAFSSADYATAAQGTLATNALPKVGGTMTGDIVFNSSQTFDGIDVSARDAVLTTTTTTASAALPKVGGAMTGAITTNSTFDGRDVATDGTKLDGIEASATADQTNAEIVAAVEAGTDSNTFTDADHTKLDGIEASADVTDATNVIAAGAMLWQSAWPDDPDAGSTVVGYNAGGSTMTGPYNSALGYEALAVVTSGYNNTALGYAAANDVTSGLGNTAVGAIAMVSNTTDSYSTAVGYASGNGDLLTKGTYVGALAGNYAVSSKDYQVAVGYNSMNDCDADYATAVGTESMSDGNHYKSTAVGYDALGRSSTSNAQYNTAVGSYAGADLYSGDYNTNVGYLSTVLSTSSFGGVAVGASSKTSSYGVSIGYQASYSGSDASLYTTVVGYRAGYDTDGGDNCTFLGYYSGYAGGSGSYNSGSGSHSLKTLTSGAYNTSVGNTSLYSLTSGDYNTSLGSASGYSVSTTDGNTLLGANSGYSQGGSTTNALTTGSNVTCVGYESMPSAATATNEITLGDNNIASLRCNVQTISSLSDERDKTAITGLTHGLDFINDMRPVEFTWNRRDGSLGAKPDMGFIAQDLYDVELTHSSASRTRLVKWDDPSKLEADYLRTYPILVKAVQELSAKNEALEARIIALEGL